MSSLFLRTLRDDPTDAELPSHKLLVRAGYVRRVGPGIYSWLPLGLMAVRNVERVVREEMVAMGAQEVLFPALVPAESFERSGRWADYGASLFRLKDRRGADYLLAPTHEELFTLLAKSECSSYKDFPLSLFQIQAKYRDEARPRAGVLRGREFVMKDSYSFDISDEGLDRSYRAHRDAYERIFTRLGFEYQIVYAVSGAMGGSASEEFIAPTPSGEDTFVRCANCKYAANAEAAELGLPPRAQRFDDDGLEVHPPAEVLDTPGTPTIATLVDHLNALAMGRTWSAADTLKNVVVKTRAPGGSTWQLVVVGVPGDREVDIKRLGGRLEPTEVEPAGPEDLAGEPALVKGYIGPQHLAELGARYVVDPLVRPGSAWVTGANEPGRHMVNVVRGRDFVPDAEIGAVEVRNGDPCPRCGQPLQVERGIELGHVFQLGRKYAEVFGLQVAGPDGTAVTVTMGSYGIGVTRAVAALAEQAFDRLGLRWPREVAPAQVHVVAMGKDDEPFEVAARTASQLQGLGLRVLYDDRVGVSAGVKFADADLLGAPLVVTAGRALARGALEVRDRWSGERDEIALEGAADEIVRRSVAQR
ncbi:MAG TPA: proline--tRNA ligase [Acidimicrobiales bacterium]|nr:proline--tRNA ligase [Acidimicrobiales bacterium]